jgi:hypothetical protein
MATWNDAFNLSPANADNPLYGASKIRETRLEVDERLEQEHVFHDTTATGQTIHRAGSAVAFYADYSDGVANEALDEETEPTTRPDGSTSLTAADAGRLRVDSGTGIIRVWTGTYWKKVTTYDFDAFEVDITIPTWHKIDVPTNGWALSKTGAWTAGKFEVAQGGAEIDFSSVITAGATRVKCFARSGSSTKSYVAARAKGDTDYAASGGFTYSSPIYFAMILCDGDAQVEIPLNEDGIAEFAVGNAAVDLYISYPFAEFY